jgi:hypothetical protein
MKSNQPEQNRLDEQSIRKAAEAALQDLQIEVEAKSVSEDKDRWCIQFASEYSQFCDSFRDQFGKDNSFELIREKIKRHLLKQQQNKIRSGVRFRRGKPQPQQQHQLASDNLLDTAVKTIEAVASQTAGLAGEIINQASSLPETVSTVLDNATTAISQISAPAPQHAPQAEQPLARLTVKAAAGKATKKSPRSASKGGSKKSGAAKKGGPAKKAASKRKPVASKSTSKSSRKIGHSSKKSTSKKSTGSKKSTK